MSGDYKVQAQVKLSKWNAALQQAVEGWNITVLWHRTNTSFTVFVPGDEPAPAEVDAAVRATGYNTEQIASLGSPASAAPPAK